MKLKLSVEQRNVSICSDSQTALKTHQAAKTTSPLVKRCQKALNDISTRHNEGLYWVPRQAGVRGNEIACKLARSGSTQTFIGPEPSIRVSRRNINNKIKFWVGNQHLAMWRGHCSTQRQALKLITPPRPDTKARLLSFNRAQSRAVIGFLTGHNAPRRHI